MKYPTGAFASVFGRLQSADLSHRLVATNENSLDPNSVPDGRPDPLGLALDTFGFKPACIQRTHDLLLYLNRSSLTRDPDHMHDSQGGDCTLKRLRATHIDLRHPFIWRGHTEYLQSPSTP